MLENLDEVESDFVILMSLRDQPQMRHDVFEEAEVGRIRDENCRYNPLALQRFSGNAGGPGRHFLSPTSM